MSHFAKISEKKEVLTVLALDDKDTQNSEGVEVESIGQAYLQQHNNWPAELWVQTSYNTVNGVHINGGTALRGNFAGIGSIWNETDQIFWPKKPYPSWVKHYATACWKSPLGDAPSITDEQDAERQAGVHNYHYYWDESVYEADNTTGWVLSTPEIS